MKTCSYCGAQYPDETTVCPTDGHPLQAPGTAQAIAEGPSKKGERERFAQEVQRFWDRMTFHQFGVVIIRLQALWLLFYAAIAATYLPTYLTSFMTMGSWAAMSHGDRVRFGLLLLRIIAHVAAAVALVQHAERILDWLVRDTVRQQSRSEGE